MTDRAVISATFSEWKMVKTRKTLQLVFEVPLEKQAEVLRVLGTPMPDKEHWCAIAPLVEKPKASEAREHKSWGELSPTQQAGIRCGDIDFRRWVHTRANCCVQPTETEVARWVRSMCGVESRSELNSNEGAAATWRRIDADFLNRDRP